MSTHPGPFSALVTLPVPPDADGVARVLCLERAALDAFAGEVTTVPAFNRLLIEGRSRTWDPERIERRVEDLARACLEGPAPPSDTAVVTLPACYDEEVAPDLASVAEAAGLAASDVASRHSGRTYAVLATGFAPGFAYLGDLDPELARPRRTTPRPRVPAGSIGIADRRTGVYPSEGPGGWHLIGRVPAALFRDAAERLGRFEPGGRVEFRPITRRDYEAEAT